MKKRVIVFEPSGLRISVDGTSTILEAVRYVGLHVNSECGGRGTCGKCIVRIYPSPVPVSQDVELIPSANLNLGDRLACQHTVNQEAHVVLSNFQRYTKILVEGKSIAQEWDIDPGLEGQLGIAIDLGTTTIVAYLLDLATGVQLAQSAILNPQVIYGEDVISRITHVAKEKDGASDLFESVSKEMTKLVSKLIEVSGNDRKSLSKVSIVGNTAMHHLLLRADVKKLGVSPYEPSIKESIETTGDKIGLTGIPDAKVYFPPNVSGFVGGDTLGFILSQRLDLSDKVVLGIDVGTNGEIVLSNCGEISCCSAAAGSAFEGSSILNGMRGEHGAIEYISIFNPDLQPEISVIGNVAPRGLCGSAIVDVTAEMIKTGLIDSRGRIQPDSSKRIFEDDNFGRSYLIASEKESEVHRDIVFTQKDVRQVQLAKAAIHGGSEILLRESNLNANEIDILMLAGAFGSYIRPKSALRIGLFPQVHIDRIIQVGNAAGEGAKLLLLSIEKRRLAEKIASEIKYLELANHQDFEAVFIESLRFPD